MSQLYPHSKANWIFSLGLMISYFMCVSVCICAWLCLWFIFVVWMWVRYCLYWVGGCLYIDFNLKHIEFTCSEMCYINKRPCLRILPVFRYLGKADAFRYNQPGFRGPERNEERKQRFFRLMSIFHLLFFSCVYLHIYWHVAQYIDWATSLKEKKAAY